MDDDLFDLIQPLGFDNHSKQQELTLSEKIKKKRELLLNYAIKADSTTSDFNQIIEEYDDEIPYAVGEALDLAQSNIELFPKLNQLVNNFDMYYNKKLGPYILKYAKEHNILNRTFTKVNHYQNNPYYNVGVSNKEFNEIWSMLKKKYSFLRDDDKELTCKLFTIDELKYECGYNSDQEKTKISKEDKENGTVPSLNLSIPKTKANLYEYWYNNLLLHNLVSDDMILGNISALNANDIIKDIKVAFISTIPDVNDVTNRTLFSSSPNFEQYQRIISTLQLQSSDYILLNICTSIKNFNKENLYNSYCNVFTKIIDEVLPKNCILVPHDMFTYQSVFGCNDLVSNFKISKHLISSAIVTNNFNELYKWIFTDARKPSVKRCNTFTHENVLTNISNIESSNQSQVKQVSTIDNNQVIDTNLQLEDGNIPFRYTKKQYTFKELENLLKELPGYNIMYISKSIIETNKGSIDKKGIPYLVLRNGKDKRFYYMDPEITVGACIHPDAKVEEPLNRLILYNNIHTNNIYKAKMQIEQDITERYNVKPKLYNTDFSPSVYISSHIRNRLHYEEGLNTPRVAVIDFETEKSAIKAKPSLKSIDAKVRLISYLDVMDKTFYCAVLKDPNYHKDLDLSSIKEHDGYKVVIDEYDNELDMWKWLNEKIYTLDPDIITGWNVIGFDLTYAIIRCRTLGITFKSRYGEFKIIEYREKKQKSYSVGVDGIVIMDYKYLFQKCALSRYENYKLEYICQEILKKGKRPMLVNDHDVMYFHHLKEYILYNIEDDERILDLEAALNYLRFQFELCNVCNISWDEIFNKTKLIDGLVYNHAWDFHQSLIKSNSYGTKSENIYQTIMDNLKIFIDRYNVDYISNNTISLKDYIKNTVIVVNDNDDEDDKYEGATVLLPQKGVYGIVADLDASQMYPRIMIRSNIFKDTLCGIIAYKNEEMAEKWIYDRDNFPSEIPFQFLNDGKEELLIINKEQFEEYLKDKILTPFGTVYWSPKVKRSLVSNILIWLIENRNKYKALMDKATEDYTNVVKVKGENDPEALELDILRIRYTNLQMAYKQLINSIYGAAGTGGYKLNDPYSAASITACGRELTRVVAHFGSAYMDSMMEFKSEDIPFETISLDFKTVNGFEDINNRHNALYGDTDSSMFWIGKVLNSIYGNISLDEQLEHAWNIIRRTSRFINEYIIKFLLERKNIDFYDDDKDYNYSYKEEWVCENIIFGTQKKQYAMHMVLKNGKRLDKIDIAGMTIKKSDTPRFAREFGSKVINYILKEYDSTNSKASNAVLLKMYNDAVTEAKKLMDEGSQTIAKPSSIKDLSAYKSISADKRGCMIYDIIYDHEYMIGDKGYQFDIESIDFNKLGITPNEIKERFKARYGNQPWYENFSRTCKDSLFFSSITIPVDVDNLDVSIFKVNKEKMLQTSLKTKVSTLYDIVGINALDEKDEAKLRKNGIMKFDVDDLLFNI